MENPSQAISRLPQGDCISTKAWHPGAGRAERANVNVMSTQSWTKHPGKMETKISPQKLNKTRANLSRFLRHSLNQSRMCVLSSGLTDKLRSGKTSKRPTQTFFTYLPRKVPQKRLLVHLGECQIHSWINLLTWRSWRGLDNQVVHSYLNT